ncbi:hypothetical protein CsSME_00001280 [Camellia sinensis var. sinensis]
MGVACSRYADTKRIETPAQVIGIKRLPLSEIPMNTPSPASFKGSKIPGGECNISSCSGGISVSMIDDSLSIRTMGVDLENEAVPNSFETPTRQLECSGSLCSDAIFVNGIESIDDSLSKRKTGVVLEDQSGLSSFVTPVGQLHFSALCKSSSVSSVLDEDIDNTILEEIDALCEQKTVVNSGREECSGIMNSSEDQECGVGELRISVAAQNGSMLEESVKYMDSLNDRQREAACSDISIPLMIVAGPGSGKTATMVGRVLMLLNEVLLICYILLDHLVDHYISAVSEMRDRIGAVAGKATAKDLTISTFHSFSLQLCHSHTEKLGCTPEFLICGHGQQRRAIIEAVRLLGNGKNRVKDVNSPQYFKDKSKKWQKFVAQAKASGKTPEDCHKVGDAIGAAILQNFNDILRTCNALDYHDLINCSVKLHSDFPEVFKECQKSWKEIVIDEFQDTSSMQYGLLRILATHKRITIVGDEDQSIFSFNGADVSGFDSFRKDFPNHKEVRLNKNYRSTRCIVEAASSLIKNNLNRGQLKNVLTDNSCGSKIIIISVKECCNEVAQCAFVVDKILEITSEGSSAKGSYGNIAVLYRRQVKHTFNNEKIPFNIHGVAFYRKKVVKAIIAMLRTMLPGCDDGSFCRVFKALLPFDKEEKKKVIDHIDKISTVRRCSLISAACDIFSAKISGTFKRMSSYFNSIVR